MNMDSQTSISQINPMLGESSICNHSITDNDIKDLEISILKCKESRLITEEDHKEIIDCMDPPYQSHPQEELEELRERLLKVEEKLLEDLSRKTYEDTKNRLNSANPSDLLNKFTELK